MFKISGNGTIGMMYFYFIYNIMKETKMIIFQSIDEGVCSA